MARFETGESGEHRLVLRGATSELLLARQPRFGLLTLILTAVGSTFLGIGAFLLRVMVRAFRPAEPGPRAWSESLVREPPRNPAHPGAG